MRRMTLMSDPARTRSTVVLELSLKPGAEHRARMLDSRSGEGAAGKLELGATVVVALHLQTEDLVLTGRCRRRKIGIQKPQDTGIDIGELEVDLGSVLLDERPVFLFLPTFLFFFALIDDTMCHAGGTEQGGCRAGGDRGKTREWTEEDRAAVTDREAMAGDEGGKNDGSRERLGPKFGLVDSGASSELGMMMALGQPVACGGLVGEECDDLFDDGLGDDGDVAAGSGMLESLECF